MGSESKKSFYVWFLGARECPGLRGDHHVRPVVRHLKQKEEEREPSKVTLQISSKGIKLIAEALKHFIPSHAVTFVSQESAPDDDIVSAILLLYNPITKCPIHVHSYRCDSAETAEILRQNLQILVDLPDNKRKIRDLEDRLQSQGLYLSSQTDNRLLKSCDTGFGGSSADLLSATDSDDDHDNHATRIPQQSRHATKSQRKLTSAPKDEEEERITRLFDSLAAELRDKLSSSAAPLLLPPRDYEAQPTKEKHAVTGRSQQQQQHRFHEQIRQKKEDSSGPSSGIGSDLEEQVTRGREQLKNRSCEKLDYRSKQQQLQRHSYHESSSSMVDRKNLGRSANDLTKIRHSRTYYREADEPPRGKVREVLSLFESKHENDRMVAGNLRSKSFCNEIPASWLQTGRKRNNTRGPMYNELNDRERYPGLDRETARLEHHQSFSRLRRSAAYEERVKSSDFLYRNSDFADRDDSVPVFVETLGHGHFRAVRGPLGSDKKHQTPARR